MCIKTVYHNTYRDGQYDVTERVEACTPGYMCANPLVVEYDREYTIARHEAKALQAKTDRAPFHASPRAPRPSSPSGSGSGSGSSHHHNNNAPRNRTSGIYAPASSATAAPAATTSTAPRPIPIPIPIRRAATMTYGGMEPPPERGRRPIIVEDRVPRSPRASGRVSASPAPVEVLAHTSSPSRRRSLRHHSQLHHHDPDFDVRRGSSGGLRAGRIPLTVPPPESNGFLSPQRAADASPQGYGSAEDEKERAERRRRRRAARERASVLPSSLPAFGNTDVFGSSYESTAGGSNGSSSAAARRPVNESRAAAAEREYQDRLRNRFSMPPRRYTAGNSFKRRTEIWYPDEGRYRFM
ncbi:hypothetical protein SPI_06915 [Niveomyces insectorum RCEF 264]|uniref:Uncharacterized protein n=1 Tax=Niveomyces insectorum RCEF 264 TaxID=1081102 RepID=A0A167QW98_9HYPO|nr:hypothetical protein SPI_06915 [Niveomyces insectorum RCEF 264]